MNFDMKDEVVHAMMSTDAQRHEGDDQANYLQEKMWDVHGGTLSVFAADPDELYASYTNELESTGVFDYEGKRWIVCKES